MTKIGLVSDTHGIIDDKLIDFFEGVDEIWHAGDAGTIDVLDSLGKEKTLRAVYGNIDGHEVRLQFPEHNRFRIENIDVWITHIGGYPGKYDRKIKNEILSNPPDLFISGHSHILKVMYDEKINCMHMNPGAYGKSGMHKVRTALRFVIDKKEIKDLEILEIKR